MIYNAKWINCWTARRLVIPKLKDEFFYAVLFIFSWRNTYYTSKVGHRSAIGICHVLFDVF
jgi:hypothetical protein